MVQKTKEAQLNSRTLSKNAKLNFIGQIVVAICAIVLLPHVIRLMGYSSYGLLSLALTVFGSFSLLELGLGRATTKFVAEYISKNEYDKIASVIWSSIIIQLVIGIIGGVFLALFAQEISERITLQSDLKGEAEKIFYILAVAIPLILGSSALRGALEGAQRFDLVNYIKILLNLSAYLVPFIGAKLDLAVSEIVMIMLIARFLGTIAYLFSCISIFPQLRRLTFPNWVDLKKLFSYAGWVAISSFIVPFLVQIDRFVIAAYLSISAVTYYAVPFELLNGLWIIPGSIVAVLFPAFSATKEKDSHFSNLFHRPIKYILISLGPVVLVMFSYSHEILSIWQGAIISNASGEVLKILVLGVLVNSLSWVPTNLIMGSGRPDIVAKAHMIQTPLYFLTLYYFVVEFGIVGAAMAYTLRASFESLLFFIISFNMFPSLRRTSLSKLLISGVLLIGLSILLFLNNWLNAIFITSNLILLFTILSAYMISIWLFSLDEYDKRLIRVNILSINSQ
jgi:O-antigen/teichoic acid export membrane protein